MSQNLSKLYPGFTQAYLHQYQCFTGITISEDTELQKTQVRRRIRPPQTTTKTSLLSTPRVGKNEPAELQKQSEEAMGATPGASGTTGHPFAQDWLTGLSCAVQLVT